MLQYQDQLLPRDPEMTGEKYEWLLSVENAVGDKLNNETTQDFEPIKHMLIDQANRQHRQTSTGSTVSSHGWLSTSSTTCASSTTWPHRHSQNCLQHALPV
jgi:hypothetical protein